MRIVQPDPDYTSSDRSARNFALAVKVSTIAVAVMWMVHLLDRVAPGVWRAFGIQPRSAEGLVGIATAPLLHRDIPHLFANTAPLWLLSLLTLFLYPNLALRALPGIWLGTGAAVWLLGRTGNHIGASGMVYGLFGLVLVSGLVRRDMRAIGAGLVVFFLYGSMIWGVFPSSPDVSFESHSAAFALGCGFAIWYRNYDRPPRRIYSYELEEDD